MPVMEGKCVLFKAFGDVDAIPPVRAKPRMWTRSSTPCYLLSGSFGGINLEDISAPRCFEIERKLKEKCDIPIFHDDQHGTAVITLAGLHQRPEGGRQEEGGREDRHLRRRCRRHRHHEAAAFRRASENIDHVRPDRRHLCRPRKGMNWIKEEMAQVTNLQKRDRQALADVHGKGADVFIGVSAPGALTTRDGGDHESRTPSSLPVPTPPRRSSRKRPRQAVQRLSPPAAATTPTRSITCWPSPAFSGVPSMFGPATSMRR